MNRADDMEILRARVASLGPEQRDALRHQLEARGIAWESFAPPSELEAVEPPQRMGRAPLSTAQMHFWVQQHLNPNTSAFHIAFAWRFYGLLDVAALGRSLQFLVDRHESLRSCFPLEDGHPWQKVVNDCRLSLTTTDLRRTPERVEDCAQAVVNTPFDMTQAPLIRAHLFRLDEAESALAICIHHTVADGWSRGIFIRELALCYRAFSSGNEPDLPPLQTCYSDFVLAEQDWMASPNYLRDKSWWQDRLSGVEPQELPADKPHSGAVAPGCATLTHALPTALSGEVRATAARLGATSFMVLLAAFKLLLHRYTGHKDLSVCVPTAGRRQGGASDVIGLFVNTLVLRTELQPHHTFSEWLARVRETTADAFEHQDFPFLSLVEALALNRDAGQSQLFQTFFQVQTEGYQHQNAETIDLGVSDLRVTQELIPLAEAKADLSWLIMEREDGLSLNLEFRTGVFSSERMERMVKHFETLLASIVRSPNASLPALDYLTQAEKAALVTRGVPAPIADDPSQSISTLRLMPEVEQIGLLPDAERLAVVTGFNDTSASYPSDRLIHELFEAQVERTPEAVAVVHDEASLSYGELNARANRLAHHLRGLGVRPDDRVAICVERSLDMVVALLAVLKAGGAYVPLDPDYPSERLAFMLADSAPRLLLTTPHLAARLETEDLPVVELTAGRDWDDAPSHNPDRAGLTPASLAYVIYTSGSTGKPKGAMIEHGGLVNLIAWSRSVFGEAPVLLQRTSFGFDAAVWEFFAALTYGGQLVLARHDGRHDPAYLIDLIRSRAITTAQFVPTQLRLLLDEPRAANCDMLTDVVCGGEALTPDLVRRFCEVLPHVRLHNLYGPTEATVDATAWTCPSGFEGQTVPLGAPISNTQIYILDAHGSPVPIGVTGELYIGGAGVARGYL
ncbi:amino acid adenylation domain-containing protein, partial [Agrobacterium vitis]|uniref:amino acid adenylation domain-containing protein n=1 Tax=Agrobacterium vitis TaxID=373 RepID=UPI0012E89294